MYKIRVYKIVNDDDDKIYVGSTQQSLSKRWHDHVKSFKNGHLQEKSKLLFETYGVDNCHIILIKSYMVHSREEQLKHERKHYDELKPNVVNVRRPHVNKQEWKEYHRDYRKKNTDKCKVWKLTYRSKHKQFYCICGGTCRWEDKARHLKQKQHLDFMKKYKSNDPHQLFECCEILYKHSKQMLSN